MSWEDSGVRASVTVNWWYEDYTHGCSSPHWTELGTLVRCEEPADEHRGIALRVRCVPIRAHCWHLCTSGNGDNLIAWAPNSASSRDAYGPRFYVGLPRIRLDYSTRTDPDTYDTKWGLEGGGGVG